MEADQPITLEQLVEKVSPSVVSVEWTTGSGANRNSAVSVGCVLHNFEGHNLILTTSRGLGTPGSGIRSGSRLSVRFQDGVEMRSHYFLKVGRLEFVVLYTEAYHEIDPIQLRNDPISFSSGLCIVPKTKTKFHKIQGFIPRPACTAHNLANDVPEITNNQFIFVCQHEDTAKMKSAPIFHDTEDRQVSGFIFQDCSLQNRPEDDDPKQEFVDRVAKICVKGSHLEAMLRMVTGDHDWRAGLVRMAEAEMKKQAGRV